MNIKEYQSLAMRTNDHKSTNRLKANLEIMDYFKIEKSPIPESQIDIGGVLNGCLGLAGEAGEFNDLIKKWIFHEKRIDTDHAKKELGDVLWYVALICESFNWNMSDIMQLNVDKLKARYPEGFDVDKSNHRAADDI